LSFIGYLRDCAIITWGGGLGKQREGGIGENYN